MTLLLRVHIHGLSLQMYFLMPKNPVFTVKCLQRVDMRVGGNIEYKQFIIYEYFKSLHVTDHPRDSLPMTSN